MAEEIITPPTPADSLIIPGVELAQRLNDQIFHIKEFKKWSEGTMALAGICFGAASAKVAEMSRTDYLSLCEAAFKLIEGKRKGED